MDKVIKQDKTIKISKKFCAFKLIFYQICAWLLYFPTFQKEKNIKKYCQNVVTNLTGIQDDDYWSLIDIAKFINETEPRYPIQNWMRFKDTILFLGLWESLNNPNFNRVEFDAVVKETGQNRFVIMPTLKIGFIQFDRIRSN